jgi:tripartite-type tricarboxylate transporter receptor subunit TctC
MLHYSAWLFARCSRITVAATAAYLAAATPAAAQPAPDFYRGKTVTLIVGSSPGGGYDALARLLARHLGRFIPGNPTVVVQNLPGGGSVTMTNRVAVSAPQDGTFIGLPQRGVLLSELTKQPGVMYQVEKLNWMGSIASEVAMVVSWHTSPVKKAEDLLTTELTVGGSGATSDMESSARLMSAAAGMKFKVVSGYPGTADVVLALQRGEVEGMADWSWAELKMRNERFLHDKQVNLLMQNALKRAPDLPDVPLAIDFIKGDVDHKVAELYFGMKEIARPLFTGPGVPADRVEMLRKAFDQLPHDTLFQEDAEKTHLEIDARPAEEITSYVKIAAGASPEVVQRLTSILNPFNK